MQKKTRLLVALLTPIFLFTSTGCTLIYSGVKNSDMTEVQARVVTAEHFGVKASAVTITNFSKELIASVYKARVNGKLYNCQFLYGAVHCLEPGKGW